MDTLEVGGRTLELNAEGFLADGALWSPEVAEAIAREIGLAPLTEKHWTVIRYCREDAAREGQTPGPRRIAKFSGVSMKELYELFPKGPGKLAARVAGLPKPKGCV